MLNVTQAHPVGANVIHAEGWTDMKKLKDAFCDHVNEHKKQILKSHSPYLDTEQVADVDVLVCVSHDHCDG
jgi:hypothetical protein